MSSAKPWSPVSASLEVGSETIEGPAYNGIDAHRRRASAQCWPVVLRAADVSIDVLARPLRCYRVRGGGRGRPTLVKSLVPSLRAGFDQRTVPPGIAAAAPLPERVIV